MSLDVTTLALAKSYTNQHGGSGGQIQPDWNQNDETAKDYVKNRPFYTGDPVETVLVEESTVPFADDGDAYLGELESTFSATVGETYKVSWDGTTYESTCVNFSGQTIIGNLSIAGAGSDTGEPFAMIVYNGLSILVYTADTSASHTFSISGNQTPIVKIPAKYIDKDTSGYIVVHNSSAMTEEEAKNYNSAISKREAVFIIWDSLYISEIYVDTVTDSTGVSVVYLRVNTLNGESYIIAQNSEGSFNLNDRKLNYATFPQNKVTGDVSSEIDIDKGKIRISSSRSSSGVGTTDALFYVQPNGIKSKSFEVLGNGEAVAPALILYSSTANSIKKFRITLDDNYNVSATNTSDSVSKALATTEYVDNSVSNPLNITSAAVGQIAKITAVDENGKPTVWEAVDMPSGSIPKPLTYDYMPEGYPSKSVVTVTLMEEQQVAFTLIKVVYMAQITNAFEVVEGQTYTVNWDGTEYECVCSAFKSMPYLGNLSVIGAGDDTGEPFVYVYDIQEASGMFATHDTSASHTISVKTTGETVTPMAEEFIPSTVTAVIENAATKENPVFTGSFSQNRKNNTTVGDYSFAEGQNTTASGVSSHAEGTICKASGWYTHAEGDHCTAQGKNQHVQGKYNIVSGTSDSIVDSDYSHIVGNGTSDSERSNAHTLTWSGVPWYQGRPQFGGDAMDNGAQTVMANGDKEIILASSTANSTKKFRITVDDSGNISATEVT